MSPRRQQIDTSSATKLVASLVGHENVISISRLILRLLGGDYPAAILLCQSIYWQSKVEEKKGGTKDGYFWKSMADWQKEIALSEYLVRTATKRLIKAGFLKTVIRKAWSEEPHDMVPTVHYQVLMDNLLESLLSLVSTESIPEEINFPLCEKCGIDSEEIEATITTKTTKTKITPTPTTPPPSDQEQAEVEEYIRLETDRAERAWEIRTSKTKYAAGIRKQIVREGGKLTPERQRELEVLRTPPTPVRSNPVIAAEESKNESQDTPENAAPQEATPPTIRCIPSGLPPWEQEILRTREYLKKLSGA